jgi:MFS family permease
MPTDGTLFLENLPHSKQYLLTLLSVFFSLGAVLSSVVSLWFLPGHSCREYEGCDIAGKANDGWRSVLFVLGIFVSLYSSWRKLAYGCRTWSARLRDGDCSGYTNHLDIWFRPAELKKPFSSCELSRRTTTTPLISRKQTFRLLLNDLPNPKTYITLSLDRPERLGCSLPLRRRNGLLYRDTP